jgi:hypothetical protein
MVATQMAGVATRVRVVPLQQNKKPHECSFLVGFLFVWVGVRCFFLPSVFIFCRARCGQQLAVREKFGNVVGS